MSKAQLMRKSTLALLIASVLAVTAACNSSGGAAEKNEDGQIEVTINQAFQSLLYLPLYVAQEEGFFEDEGVSVKIATAGGGAQAWSAVLGGSADFSIQDPVFVPKTRESGGEGVVVAGVQNAPTVFIFGQDDTSLQDNLSYLEGKTVVTGPEPDTTWAFMTHLIEQNDLKDVKIINVAIGNEIAAVASGQADYALAVEPQVTQAVIDNGLHSVYSFSANPDWYPYAFSSLTTTPKYTEQNPEATQGVVTAFERASRFIYDNLDRSVEIGQKYFPDLSEEIIRESIQREIDAKGYPENVGVTQEAWDANLEIALKIENVSEYPSDATSYENNVDNTFADKAKETVDAE